uniref:J domain-containing protein n=1 Tax=Pinguiococcus pyrenoidosus TaxID=172671 RepID=A0A7R9UBA1_9STRA|mmetsp:Transcript_3929/g.15187  ORF Transcript_3929/g.15187 Transcript_3929/m.15187 type:complete len:376 (+) Transcript_3929:50-1177(+)
MRLHLLLLSLALVQGAGDYYKLLQVPRTASERDISKAFRRLARTHHPDKNPSNREKAEQKFKELTRAHEVLKDPQKRQIYDATGRDPDEVPPTGFGGPSSGFSGFPGGFPGSQAPPPGFSFGGTPGFDFPFQSSPRRGPTPGQQNDILDELLGAFLGRRRGQTSFTERQAPPQEPEKEVFHEMHLTLDQLYAGARRKIRVVHQVPNSWTGAYETLKEVYSVRISPGYRNGTKLRFKGRTREVNGMQFRLPPVTITIHEKPHPFLVRTGKNHEDLLYVCNLTVDKVLSGRTLRLRVPLPCGKTAEVRLKPKDLEAAARRLSAREMEAQMHWNAISRVFVAEKKLVGMGMPRARGLGLQYGDLLVRFEVIVSKAAPA